MKNLLLLLFSLTILASCANSTDNGYDDSADLEFLEENLQKEGVIETDSGLQYRVIEEGDGDKPFSESIVFVEYLLRTINGDTEETDEVVFFQLDQVIPGFSEGIQLMNEGSVYELVMPSELAFDDGRALIAEIELFSFLMDPEEFLDQNAQEEGIEVTDSGLQYRILEEGDGDQPADDSEVSVVYTGTFTNGHIFDTSDGDATNFFIDKVIPGFGEGLQLMKEGAKYELFIPYDIGYSENPRPNIPPGAVLVFEVELKEVDPS